MMSIKVKLFLILMGAGVLGVLTLLLIDLPGLIAILPVSSSEIPTITPAIRLLSLLQPLVLIAIAVSICVALASKVGLASPAAEAAASGGSLASALGPQIFPGIIGGLIGGCAVVLIAATFTPFLPPELVTLISAFGKLVPLPTRLFYGGIVEELLLRWGFMTLLVWLGWKLFQKGRDAPTSACFISAILISSVVFGIGHLPVAFMCHSTLEMSYFLPQ